jgi:putative peptidoglycan lipid II flippase
MLRLGEKCGHPLIYVLSAKMKWLRESIYGRVLAATVTIAGISSVVKLGSLGKEMLLARYFGASDKLDAFYVAFLLPTYFIGIIANLSYDAFMPTYIEVRESEGESAAHDVFSNTAAFTLLALAALAATLGLLQRWLLPVLGSGFEASKIALARTLFLVLLASLFLSGFNTIWRAALNAHERFALTAASPIAIPLSICIMLLVRGSAWTVYALTLGCVLGAGVELLTNGYGLWKLKMPLLPRWRGLDRPLRQIIRQATPAVAGAILIGSSTIVDQSMAATLSSGSVSILNYANKLILMLLAIGTSSLSMAMLPALSKLSANRNWQDMRNVLSSYTRLVVLVSVPAMLIVMAMSKYLIMWFYLRGSFTFENVELTARVQYMLCLELPFYSLAILYVSGLCALKRNYVLMWGTVISVVENVVLNYIFMRLFGLPGIALSTSVVYATSCLYLRLMLSRTLREQEISVGLPAVSRIEAGRLIST